MSIKPIKIVNDGTCWGTKIYEGDKDVTEIIGGIFGIDIRLRVDEPPKVTIHRYGSKIEYRSESPHELTVINYEPKKTYDKNVLEDTNYSNSKNGNRHFIKNKEMRWKRNLIKG